MEIIIYTHRKALLKQLTSVVNATLKYSLSNLASLNPGCPGTKEELSRLIKPNKSYLILADIGNDGGSLDVLEHLQRRPEQILFLLIGRKEHCCQAIHRHLKLADYIEYDDPNLTLKVEEGIRHVLGHIRSIGAGLFAWMNGECVLIPFDDIYFIETIKRTHQCEVHHTGGTASLRGTISDLSRSLDPRFRACSHSAIVNFSRIHRVDYVNRNLFFTDHLWCGFSQSKKDLVKSMQNNKLRVFYLPE